MQAKEEERPDVEDGAQGEEGKPPSASLKGDEENSIEKNSTGGDDSVVDDGNDDTGEKSDDATADLIPETRQESGEEKSTKGASVEEEVAALLQNLANKPSEQGVAKRARRSARERKSSLYSDYETEFKGNWDLGTEYAPRRKDRSEANTQPVDPLSSTSTKDVYNGFPPEFGKKIAENSKRLLDLLQSSAHTGQFSQVPSRPASAPSWKPSRLSIAKFIEAKIAGQNAFARRDYETAFARITPQTNYPTPAMNGGRNPADTSADTARLLSLLSTLTNRPESLLEGQQQGIPGLFQGMPGAQQQGNSSLLQALLQGSLSNQTNQQMHQYPYPGLHNPASYHQ